MQIGEMKDFQDKTVVLLLNDGEMATVKVNSIDVEYEDMVVDLLRTNLPGVASQLCQDNCFTIRAADVLSAREIVM